MYEAYSQNITVPEGSMIPLNVVLYNRSCGRVEQSGAAATKLNKCGTYKVSCTGTVAGESEICLAVDGIALPQTVRSTTAEGNFAIDTVIPVKNCRASVLSIMNTGAEVTFDVIDLVVQ